MKVLVAILSVLALVGVLWTLAFLQVIPAQKIADKSPGAARALIALGVAKSKPKAKPKAALVQAPSPAVDPLASEKAALDAEKEQLDQEKATLDMRLKQASSGTSSNGVTGGSGSTTDTSPKLVDIYGTMKSDDLARIFAKLPDSAVVDALNQLDDRQAGKVLAALPDERAAKITALMNHVKPQEASPTATPGQSPQQIASSPAPTTP